MGCHFSYAAVVKTVLVYGYAYGYGDSCSDGQGIGERYLASRLPGGARWDGALTP